MGGYRSAANVRDVPATEAAEAPDCAAQTPRRRERWGGAVDVPARVQELAAAFVDGADVRSAGSQLVGLRSLIEQLEAVWLSAAADFQRAGGPEQEGAGSMSAWLRRECRMAPGEASARVRVAAAVTGELAATGRALEQGAISWRHADVIARTVKDVPHEHRVRAEQLLQEPAKTLDPQYLSRVGQELLHRLDVDKAEQAAVRRLERRGLDIAETLGGMVAVRGLLDPVAGASLLTAVDAKVRRTRGDLEDSRSWSQRRADALAEITDEWLSRGGPSGRRATASLVGDRRHRVLAQGPGLCGGTAGVGGADHRRAGADAGVRRGHLPDRHRWSEPGPRRGSFDQNHPAVDQAGCHRAGRRLCRRRLSSAGRAVRRAPRHLLGRWW